MPPLKLVIFDLDGTLVDTSEDITESLNHAMAPFGSAPLSVEQVKGLVGEGVSRLMEKAMAGRGKDEVEEAKRRFLEHYSANLAVRSHPYPLVRETLEELGALKKAVLSNKREDLSRRLLEELGLAQYFDIIAGSDSAPERKPSAVPVAAVLRRLGVDEAEAVLVGDSGYDIEAGRKAGVKTVAVTYGYRPREALKGAAYTIDGLDELVPLLTRYSSLLERRREARYSVPGFFEKYVELTVKIADEPIPVKLLDFSEHGFGIEGPVPFDEGSFREFRISVPLALQKGVAIKARIRHVREADGAYVSGASIEEVDSEVWFRVFRQTLRFMTERMGQMY